MTAQPEHKIRTVRELKWLPDDVPELLMRREVEQFLRMSRSSVLRLMESGELPAFRVGYSYRVRAVDLDDYLDSVRTGNE